jgi:hypothetical protein
MFSLKQQRETQQQLSALCGAAVQQQIEQGKATPTQLRQRRRHLLKALRKRLPKTSGHSAQKILHTALMVLALWGFSGLAVPNDAEASALFKHVTLEGFDVGGHAALTLADTDNDGDLDAFIGETNGTVKFYRNDGTAQAPLFVAADGVSVINPLAGFDVGNNATPTFADIDGDGDLDTFVGNYSGAVKFYRNTGTAAAPAFAADAAGNPLAGVATGGRAAPAFTDIDGDGDLDALVGEKMGTVKFYRNNGTAAAPAFAADAAGNPLNGFDVGSYAAPTFADIDNDGDLDAFIGEQGGTIKLYRNNGTAYAPAIAADAAGNPLAGYSVYKAAKPVFADIDNDGDLDALVSDRDGIVRDFRNSGTASAPVFNGFGPLGGVNVSYAGVPTLADIDNDGDLDAFVGNIYGTVALFQNDGTAAAANFVAADGVTIINPLTGFDVGTGAAPAFADIDGDGDLDAFVGEQAGTVKFYRNTGTAAAPTFAADAAGNPLTGFDVGNYAAPTFADIDGDGDLDAFVGEILGTVKFYRNTGTAAAPAFVADAAGNPLAGINLAHGHNAPTFVDIDSDGDLDAFLGDGYGLVNFYQNSGTASVPSFVAADGITVINPLDGFGFGSNAAPTFADIDNDGDADAFVGNFGGKVMFCMNLESVAPQAVADNATTDENTVLNSSISLLANDTDTNGDTLSAVAGTFVTTQGGSIVINSDGNYTYTPPANFSGTDTVDYTVSDGHLTAVGTLTITVSAASSGGGNSGGGGGTFGLALLWGLVPLVWRRRRRPCH